MALVALWATAMVRGDVAWFVVAALFTLQVAVFGWWLQTYRLGSLAPDKALLPEAVRLWRERRQTEQVGPSGLGEEVPRLPVLAINATGPLA
jgi:hypothetical protein